MGVYALRLKTDGTLDADFGDAGIRLLNLNDGVEGTNAQSAAALLGADAQWGLNVDSTDRLLIHRAQRAVGVQSDGTTPRTDTDWPIVRLTKDGAVDPTFATAGKANCSRATSPPLSCSRCVANPRHTTPEGRNRGRGRLRLREDSRDLRYPSKP